MMRSHTTRAIMSMSDLTAKLVPRLPEVRGAVVAKPESDRSSSWVLDGAARDPGRPWQHRNPGT
jgi:hypothetical protein